MANVFISCRTKDEAEIKKLEAEIRKDNHDVWVYYDQIGLGDSVIGKMDEGLSGMFYLVLCYSKYGRSPYSDREWMSTLNKQLDGWDVKILPVIISKNIQPNIPPILHDIMNVDLTEKWDEGIKELLGALK